MPAECLMKQAYAIRNTDCSYFLTIRFFKRQMLFEAICDGITRKNADKGKQMIKWIKEKADELASAFFL